MIKLKRVYDPPSPSDGHRVLIDRLWPRGIKKEAAELADWPKDVAPSAELRTWFGHAPERFAEFRRRYQRELVEEPARSIVAELATRAARGTVTLLFAAKDEAENNAVVLAEAIERRLRTAKRRSTKPTARRKSPRAALTPKKKTQALLGPKLRRGSGRAAKR